MRRPDFDDPDLPLSELFQHWPTCAGEFMRRKMLCPGCPIAPFHTVIDACEEYELDQTRFRNALQEVVQT
jgi:hybrid cluster-associated redox disulfide protein